MFEQVKLAYDVDALEPIIGKETVEIHYGKHHATYATNFNNIIKEKAPELEGKTIEEILSSVNSLSEDVRGPIRNNGGGYYNHNLYFESLAPAKGQMPTGELLDKINECFGSYDEFKNQLSQAAITRFGSGWGWLIADKDGNLSITSTANQDNPIMEDSTVKPLLPLDVWEHAYYLNYQNRRPEYVEKFFEIIDWDVVARRYNS